MNTPKNQDWTPERIERCIEQTKDLDGNPHHVEAKTRADRSRYFVDMMVGGQLYAVSTQDDSGKPWSKRKAQNRANNLNARQYQQLDQPKGYFQVRESLSQST